MDIKLEQKIFNIYRHHDEELLDVICGPTFEKQIGSAMEYVKDILHVLFSNYQYTDGQSFALPEVDLDWLNVSIQSLKKSGIYGRLIINKNKDEILISAAGRFDNNLTELYHFLCRIYQNVIQRNKFFCWDGNLIQRNQDLEAKDNGLSTLYGAYKLGISSPDSITSAFKSFTLDDDSILDSSIKIFSDYKIFALAFLAEEKIMMIPYITDSDLSDFSVFDLLHLKIEQRTPNSLILKPVYLEKSIKDFQSILNINRKRFQDKHSIFYDPIKMKYVFEINV